MVYQTGSSICTNRTFLIWMGLSLLCNDIYNDLRWLTKNQAETGLRQKPCQRIVSPLGLQICSQSSGFFSRKTFGALQMFASLESQMSRKTLDAGIWQSIFTVATISMVSGRIVTYYRSGFQVMLSHLFKEMQWFSERPIWINMVFCNMSFWIQIEDQFNHLVFLTNIWKPHTYIYIYICMYNTLYI